MNKKRRGQTSPTIPDQRTKKIWYNRFLTKFYSFVSTIPPSGRAYLFDHCVNVVIGPPEDRMLITGLHSVNDIFCKRCKSMVGWTYSRAYEPSQKYKEGKFIIEKINLHLEETPYYNVAHPAGERSDRWRLRSMSWGDDAASPVSNGSKVVYEYQSSVATTLSSSESSSTASSSEGHAGSSGKSEYPSHPTMDTTTTYIPVRKNSRRRFADMSRDAPTAPTL